jgi:hypothetical protein
MTLERLLERKICETHRLEGAGLSIRTTAWAYMISNSTLGECLHRAGAADLQRR